jgi:hypothetical protein
MATGSARRRNLVTIKNSFTEKEWVRGVGMGLSLVPEIVNRYYGGLLVEIELSNRFPCYA